MSHKVYITNKQNTVKVPSGLRILIRRSCHAVLDRCGKYAADDVQ